MREPAESSSSATIQSRLPSPRANRRDRAHLQDMLESAAAVEKRLSGLDETGFLRNEILREAVAHWICAVALGASRLSSGARASTVLAWRELTTIRGLLVRPDQSIDWKLVWRTATRDLPEIRSRVEELVSRADGDSAARS